MADLREDCRDARYKIVGNRGLQHGFVAVRRIQQFTYLLINKICAPSGSSYFFPKEISVEVDSCLGSTLERHSKKET